MYPSGVYSNSTSSLGFFLAFWKKRISLVAVLTDLWICFSCSHIAEQLLLHICPPPLTFLRTWDVPGHFGFPGFQLRESENCICIMNLYSLLAASFMKVLPAFQKLQLLCGSGAPDTAWQAVDLSPGSSWQESGQKLRGSWPGWLGCGFENYLSSALRAGGEEGNG